MWAKVKLCLEHTPICSETKNKAGAEIMYAIIETGGKQYRVCEGDEIFVEKLNVEQDAEVVFDKVIAFSNGKTLKMGKPYVKDMTVTAKVLKQGKGKKINIFTYKPKKSSSRRMGHRQPYTKVQISAIGKAEND